VRVRSATKQEKWLLTEEAPQPAVKVALDIQEVLEAADSQEAILAVPVAMALVRAEAVEALPAAMAQVGVVMVRATEAPDPAVLEAMLDPDSGQEEVRGWVRGRGVASTLLRDRIPMVRKRSFPSLMTNSIKQPRLRARGRTPSWRRFFAIYARTRY
jgi:hypothetical protein